MSPPGPEKANSKGRFHTRVVRVKVYPRRRPVADVRNGAQRADLGHSGPPKNWSFFLQTATTCTPWVRGGRFNYKWRFRRTSVAQIKFTGKMRSIERSKWVGIDPYPYIGAYLIEPFHSVRLVAAAMAPCTYYIHHGAIRPLDLVKIRRIKDYFVLK